MNNPPLNTRQQSPSDIANRFQPACNRRAALRSKATEGVIAAVGSRWRLTSETEYCKQKHRLKNNMFTAMLQLARRAAKATAAKTKDVKEIAAVSQGEGGWSGRADRSTAFTPKTRRRRRPSRIPGTNRNSPNSSHEICALLSNKTHFVRLGPCFQSAWMKTE